MNKYQEALEELRNISASKRQNELYDLIQKLVDKETPMKPYYSPQYPTPDCPACKSNIGDNPRCRECGQKIDWSDE